MRCSLLRRLPFLYSNLILVTNKVKKVNSDKMDLYPIEKYITFLVQDNKT